eukprot:365140-Chlamydomonas_euryale.AAC.8
MHARTRSQSFSMSRSALFGGRPPTSPADSPTGRSGSAFEQQAQGSGKRASRFFFSQSARRSGNDDGGGGGGGGNDNNSGVGNSHSGGSGAAGSDRRRPPAITVEFG